MLLVGKGGVNSFQGHWEYFPPAVPSKDNLHSKPSIRYYKIGNVIKWYWSEILVIGMLHAGENWLWCDEFLFGETCPLPCPGEHRVIITIVLCMFFVYVFLVITIVLCSLSLFTLSSPLLHPMFQRTSPRVRLAEVMAEPKKENESPKGEDWWENMHLTDFWSFWPKWGWVKNPTLRWRSLITEQKGRQSQSRAHHR